MSIFDGYTDQIKTKVLLLYWWLKTGCNAEDTVEVHSHSNNYSTKNSPNKFLSTFNLKGHTKTRRLAQLIIAKEGGNRILVFSCAKQKEKKDKVTSRLLMMPHFTRLSLMIRQSHVTSSSPSLSAVRANQAQLFLTLVVTQMSQSQEPKQCLRYSRGGWLLIERLESVWSDLRGKR